MTKDEILSRCRWDHLDLGHLTVHSRMLGRDVPVLLNPENDQQIISDRVVQVLNDFLDLTTEDLPTVKKLLWKDCQTSFASISYGADSKPGQSLAEANAELFQVFTPEDAYAKSRLKRLGIEEDTENFKHRYGLILFDSEWASHFCGIVMQDGRLIATSEESPYFGDYE